ncbi:hypothetical protein [Nonomuraea sp. NPDC049309]|uniref:hypothetical protein n=1 Tax=Nonomuraea sp. NPDC049309 TaxID=3364350 RepID=UPI0037118AC9
MNASVIDAARDAADARESLPEERARPALAPGSHVVALLSPTPVPGTPPGSFLPGVQATGAESRDGRIVRITQLANAAPGRPDGEVDTRPLRPLWEQDDTDWPEP